MGSPNQLSFLPDDYLDRKRRRRAVALCAVLFVAVSVGMIAALWLADRSLGRARAEGEEVERRYAEAARRIAQVEKMQEKQRRMARQAELTASLLEKAPRSRILAGITNALPAGTSLLELSLDSKLRATPAPAAKTAFDRRKQGAAPPPPPGPKVYDVTVRLTGIARTDIQVAKLISVLGRSPMLKDVNLVVSEEFEQNDETLRRFQLEMTVNPEGGADLPGSAASAGVE